MGVLFSLLGKFPPLSNERGHVPTPRPPPVDAHGDFLFSLTLNLFKKYTNMIFEQSLYCEGTYFPLHWIIWFTQ